MLENCGQFSFVSLMEQPIEVTGIEIPDIFLLNYEEGAHNESVLKIEGETCYTTKSIAVTRSYFQAFSIKLEEGRFFTDEEYSYDLSSKKDIPVILGHEYQSIFQIGDRFEAHYLSEKFHFVVVGILNDEAFFFNRRTANMASCGRYVILPAFYTNSYDDFSKIMTMQRIHGIILSDIGYQETRDLFRQYQNEAGIGYWNLYCAYPSGDDPNIFQMYSAMTGEVSDQFRIIVILIFLFSSISSITMICSMLRENQTNFGIELLCGSSLKRISAQAFLMIGLIIFMGDFLALPFMLLGKIEISTFLIVQLTALLMIVASGTICAVYAGKMDLSSIIGGKE